MKLTKVHITNFQSIQDSTEFEIGDVTCLVGKNESGKTALLKALYRLNPINEADGNFDLTYDYPRQTLIDYEEEIDSEQREPAQVVQATYVLDPDDTAAVEELFGSGCLINDEPTLVLTKGYSNSLTLNHLNVDTDAAIKHLTNNSDSTPLSVDPTGVDQVVAEQTETSEKRAAILRSISDSNVSQVVFEQILQDRVPKFLYFDEYYQMKGQANLNALNQRVENSTLEDSDYPLLGLIGLARLNLNQILNPRRTETLIARLEIAGNSLTQSLLPYWSQNQHLRMEFDIRQAQTEDPPGMTSGTNIWARVKDTKHAVTTTLGARSRGFVWFFSFLAWYQKLRKENDNLILLLDEPGLSLHAKAQGDLLHYFEKELKPHHQLVYTTHSPFMVDPAHFDCVRIVQDLGIEPDSENLPQEQLGTKVLSDVLEATPDSLFPLQGALGYEIHQTLFIGPNNLIVEGVSDLLYIQTISALLQAKGEPGLSSDWTITPVGGSDKVPTFVALIGAQTNLNVAVLIDYQKRDEQRIENLYKKKLLEAKRVFTYANFVSANEADIEDMFHDDFYLKLVNSEFGLSISLTNLPSGNPRILRRLKQYFQENPLPNGEKFNHYRPARYFSENLKSLESELTEPQLNRFRKAFEALNKLCIPQH